MTKRKYKAKPEVEVEVEVENKKPLRIPTATKALAATFFAGQRREFMIYPKHGFHQSAYPAEEKYIKQRTKLENEVMHQCITPPEIEIVLRASVNVRPDKKIRAIMNVTLVLAWRDAEKAPEHWSAIITARGPVGMFDCEFRNYEEGLAYILSCDDFNNGQASATVDEYLYSIGGEEDMIWEIIERMDKQGLL